MEIMRAGYPPIIIKIENRRRYLQTLEDAENANKEPFYMFVAEHVKERSAFSK